MPHMRSEGSSDWGQVIALGLEFSWKQEKYISRIYIFPASNLFQFNALSMLMKPSWPANSHGQLGTMPSQ